MLFYELVKTHRKKLGYTQVQLSALSQVSLPTVQNIEANKGNPSYFTIAALSRVLGIDYQAKILPANWNYLFSAGLPMGQSSSPIRNFDSQTLAREIKQACLELSTDHSSENSRYQEALVAFLFAIRKHFPTFFADYLEKAPIVHETIANSSDDGRKLKLSRQAVAVLVRYL